MSLVSEFLPVAEGKLYTLSADLKVSSTSASLRLGVRWFNASNQTISTDFGAAALSAKPINWQKFSGIVTAPAGAVKVKIYFLNSGAAAIGSTGYINEVILATYTEAIVVNASDFYPFGSVMRSSVTPSFSEESGKFKFQGKERDLESGYDYFEARMYDAQLGRFTTVDPLGGKFLNVSPFVGMNNNPINLVDPTGMEWENSDDAKVLKDQANKRIKHSKRIIEESNQALENDELSDEDRSYYRDRIEDAKSSISDMEQSIQDIDAMDADQDNVYRLSNAINSDGTAGVDKIIDNGKKIVLVGGEGTMSQLHEIRHVGQSLGSGGLTFNSNNQMINPGKDNRQKIDNELNAYNISYSYAPKDMNMKRSDINEKWLSSLTNKNGEKIYGKLFQEKKKK